MLTTLLLVVLILAVGTHLSDNVRVRQEGVILGKLPLADAHAYYDVLRRRARRVRWLRAVTVLSLVLGLVDIRRRWLPPPRRGVATSAPADLNAAQALATGELRRYAASQGRAVSDFELAGVSSDDAHPYVFEYAAGASRRDDRLRVYVDRAGRTEVHKILNPAQ